MLDERKASILRAVVEEYIQTAQPVGSGHVVDAPGVSVSSATVRNEMAALEEEGMITHPHTSAGRIPSHRGYRYYVSSLMQERDLTPQEQFTILHQFHQASRQLEEWVGLAASVLLAAPAQAAQYPPSQPVTCKVTVTKKKIKVNVAPKQNKKYTFEIQKKNKAGDWVRNPVEYVTKKNNKRTVKVTKGTYRVRCYGGPNYLDANSKNVKVKK